jgi:hypothetical protein
MIWESIKRIAEGQLRKAFAAEDTEEVKSKDLATQRSKRDPSQYPLEGYEKENGNQGPRCAGITERVEESRRVQISF